MSGIAQYTIFDAATIFKTEGKVINLPDIKLYFTDVGALTDVNLWGEDINGSSLTSTCGSVTLGSLMSWGDIPAATLYDVSLQSPSLCDGKIKWNAQMYP